MGDQDAGAGREPDRPLAVLLRWEAGGARWRVVHRSPSGLQLELLTCTGDEVLGRLSAADPDLLRHVGARWSSEEG